MKNNFPKYLRESLESNKVNENTSQITYCSSNVCSARKQKLFEVICSAPENSIREFRTSSAHPPPPEKIHAGKYKHRVCAF